VAPSILAVAMASKAAREAMITIPQVSIRDHWLQDAELRRALNGYRPRTGLGAAILRLIQTGDRDAVLDVLDRLRSIAIFETRLFATVIRGSVLRVTGEQAVVREPYGLVATKVMTTAGVEAMVDAFTNTFELENFNYHAMGTGSTAEAASQTALVTELTTEYTRNVRGAGAQSQPSANIYQSLATVTVDSGTPAVREHGLFNQSATGGGVMLDRSLVGPYTLDGAAGDGVEWTWQLTLTSGG
jgi:hypothetical protein